MTEKAEELQFDFESYLASLMKVMEMDQASEAVQKDVTWSLGQQLGFRIMEALTLSFDDNDWSFFVNSGDSGDLKGLIQQAIERNPAVKEAVVETLDEFYNETLEAFSAFKNS